MFSSDDDKPQIDGVEPGHRRTWAIASAAVVVPALAVGALTLAPLLLSRGGSVAADAPAFAHLKNYAAPSWVAEPRPDLAGAPAYRVPVVPKPAAAPATKAVARSAAPASQTTTRGMIRANAARPITPIKRKPAPRPPAPAPPSSSIAAQVLSYTNRERAAAGCRALTLSSTLGRAAQGHAADMARYSYFSHTSRDGRTFGTRIRNAGWTGTAGLAENIAAGQASPSAVVTAWMNSSGHRANILNCSYRYLGVGYATGGSYGKYWVQDFAG